jgi:hypothetical protein
MKVRTSFFGNLLIYRKGYTPEFIKETIRLKKLDGLEVHDFLPPEKINDFSFLEKLVFLEKLSIVAHNDIDFSFLLKLEKLLLLEISCFGIKEINLSSQINLKDLSICWRKNIIGLENCRKLEILFLEEYHEKDLLNFSFANKLRKLGIKSSKLQSLNGIKHFKEIREVSIGGCYRLKHIKDIDGLKTLKKLEFNSCKKIIDLHELSELPQLENLTLNNCGEIKPSDFLINLWRKNKLTLLCRTKIRGIE